MDYKHIPNILSFSRFLLAMVFAWYFNNLLHSNQEIVFPLIVFILILVTDFLDGQDFRVTASPVEDVLDRGRGQRGQGCQLVDGDSAFVAQLYDSASDYRHRFHRFTYFPLQAYKKMLAKVGYPCYYLGYT